MGNKHGGSRPGAGRRRLDGQKAGAGKFVLDKTVSLPPAVVEYLSKLGNGNLSLGVRIAAEYHRTGFQAPTFGVMTIENPCPEESVQPNGAKDDTSETVVASTQASLPLP